MQGSGRRRQSGLLVGLLGMVAQLLFLVPASSVKTPVRGIFWGTDAQQETSPLGVQLRVEHQQVVMDNGLLQVNLSVPGGYVIGVHYNGSDNLLEYHNKEDDRGYWDIVWNKPGSAGGFTKLQGTTFQIIKEDTDQIELSFSSTWNASVGGSAIPLNIDRRFVMLAGHTGFYCYGVFERLDGFPDLDIDQIRIVFKLHNTKFHYMALSDERQRVMPEPQDRLAGQPLDYPEAVLLRNTSNPALRGEVDDKYQYSCDNKDNRVHGWISLYPPTGFWIITPSNEFRPGGPVKQDLTSHVGPVALSMFVSAHYAGPKAATMEFKGGKPWKKVFGPVYVYLNSGSFDDNPLSLWQDAKAQMLTETGRWPYDFPVSKDFPHADQRGNVMGQLLVCDGYLKKDCFPADSAQVGLAAPGPAGSWQTENMGYQFWNQTDKQGNFLIKGVQTGQYSVYAWVPGVMGDYVHNATVNITQGSEIELGVLVFQPPRHGPTLWEIGIPDRTAAEFHIPNPKPELVNHLYTKLDRFRQYGLWEQYTDLYPNPNQDLIYTVGLSDYRKDWFYAQVTRKVGNKSFLGTTWQILFDLQNVSPAGTYVLQLALAASSEADLVVRINNPGARLPHFTTGLIGRDNAIARHGIHGLYSLYSVNISGLQLRKGRNTIYLSQPRAVSPFQGIMYDYLRLEGPPATNQGIPFY